MAQKLGGTNLWVISQVNGVAISAMLLGDKSILFGLKQLFSTAFVGEFLQKQKTKITRLIPHERNSKLIQLFKSWFTGSLITYQVNRTQTIDVAKNMLQTNQIVKLNQLQYVDYLTKII